MKYKNCKNCLLYDELTDGTLSPCDEDWKWERHYCIAYKSGIPDDIRKGKKACPEQIEDA